MAPHRQHEDRMAKSIIEAAEADGRLRPGSTVVDTPRDDRSILALVCAAKGYDLHIVYSDAFSEEKK